jgi:hypothetical protein
MLVLRWDVIAESAMWARQRESILVDSHWVGGNPFLREVYGWAAFNPSLGRGTLAVNTAICIQSR